jgi:hypothetical protein
VWVLVAAQAEERAQTTHLHHPMRWVGLAEDRLGAVQVEGRDADTDSARFSPAAAHP